IERVEQKLQNKHPQNPLHAVHVDSWLSYRCIYILSLRVITILAPLESLSGYLRSLLDHFSTPLVLPTGFCQLFSMGSTISHHRQIWHVYA
ncbi:hypothetical protein M378DRAFT_163997, partial [Amanita muscaria Koide BX008]